MATLLVNSNDPHLADKARQFFLAEYRELRDAQLAATKAPAVATQNAGDSGKGTCFHLGDDNLPDEHLPVEQFHYLMATRNKILEINASTLPETDDPRVAAVILTRRALLNFALQLLRSLLSFLLFDKRFHVGDPIQVDALSALDPQNVWGQSETQLRTLQNASLLCNRINAPLPPNSTIAGELRVLDLVGNIYFNTLQSVFPLGSVNKCHIAFTLLMQNLGLSSSDDFAHNYLRRRKTMYREIVNWSHNGGSVAANQPQQAVTAQQEQIAALQNQVSQLSSAVATNTKTIANMDRRQKTLLEFIKKTIVGFVTLFRPSPKPPTREQIAAKLCLQDRYACLSDFKEPRRSQLKAVIDYTCKRPIVRKAKSRSEFTLANAAEAVWNENHLKWLLLNDSYETYEQLKSACYNLQEKHPNAFCYQK